jgi:single-strand DNA-binding protein
MASFNKVMLMGNLTKDPELRYIPSGAAVSTLRIAVSHQWRSASGEAKKETSFVDVIVWTKLAENCARFLKKGSPIFVEGRLRIREYAGRGDDSGKKRYATEIVANNVQFLSWGERAGGGAGTAEAAPGAPEIGSGEVPEEPYPMDEEGS